ncbi:hypothetical protein [Meiothermus sp.]|uniref:hypothetical protein n=1 Tax=Meiothermus sp. TaxID=1955249 RepID=UPI0021DC5BCB|nr:hypothetical protein [Meiothermus sp.]GIW32872.1 MAG: hypothetical protein KatS3mg072_0205 [Meiothermus sp.]
MSVPERILHDRAAFLAHFPHNQRATATNVLLSAVRAGCCNVHQVVGYAVESARQRHWNEACLTLVLLAELDPEALEAGARWALWWERQPRDVKNRLKSERAGEAVEKWMSEQPPTGKQLAFLRKLAHTGPEPANRLEASRLIDSLLREVRHAR